MTSFEACPGFGTRDDSNLFPADHSIIMEGDVFSEGEKDHW